MANERGHPLLSYGVWKINFHLQVAEEKQLLPFKLFLPRISMMRGEGERDVGAACS